MAPTKKRRARDRAENMDGEDDGTETTSMTSHFRRHPSKRPRLSVFSADDGSASLSDEIESTLEAALSRHRPVQPLSTRRDNDDTDSEEEAEDVRRATQQVTRRRERHGENLAAENQAAQNGIVESIECINFMCHSRLQINFGPNINFVIGHNGSGKSAVLTALTLCLGGKATATNRGQKLSSFIKEGTESASLIVKLKNQEPGAYLHDLYGDSIIVERHFTKAGGSSFKIKSAEKRLISTKKVDVEEICDYFALQLDNPMNVLTQDMARQFLNQSGPAEKYKFFVRGVQLEQLDQDYRILEQTIDLTESKLGGRIDDITAFKKLRDEANSKVEAARRYEGFREQLRKFERQMAWAQVEEQERALAKYEDQLKQAEETIARAQAQAQKMAEAFETVNREQELTQRSIDRIREQLQPIEEERDQLKAKLDEKKAEQMNVQAQQRNIGGEVKTARTAIHRIEQEIKAEQERLDGADGGGQARKREEIEEARHEVERLRSELDKHAQNLDQLRDGRSEADSAVAQHKRTLEAKRNEVLNAEGRLQTLMRDKDLRRNIFHQNMPTLLRAIQNDNRFQIKPVGPIGDHIKLLKPEWSSILERSFGETLNSFVCTSRKDQTILSELGRRTSCPVSILITNPDPINTTPHEPDPSFDTWDRVIEVESPVVRNALVIQHGVEQALLVRDRAELGQIMYGDQRPRNVRQGFCFNENQRGWGIRFAWTRGGQPTSGPVRAWDTNPRMKTNVESQINLQREIISEHKRELNELERGLRELNQQATRCNQAIVRHERRTKDLRVEFQRAEEREDQLKDELEQGNPQDGRVDNLREQLEEAKGELELATKQYEDAVIAKENLIADAEGLRSDLSKIEGDAAVLSTKMQAANKKLENQVAQRRRALLQKNEAFQDVADEQEKVGATARRGAEQRDLVADFERQASEICLRVEVPPNETMDTLERKMEKFERDIKRFEQQTGGTREQIAAEAHAANERYTTAKSQLDSMERLAQALKLSLLHRSDRWHDFRRKISARAKLQFGYLLTERDFRGEIVLDHRQKVLELAVEPDMTKTANDGGTIGRQTKTLSGGEKSFSTICLLLSLWEAMGSPIRCLDEFDVFMDVVNRDRSMEMMVTAARRSVARQYILITPQAMHNAKLGSDVKIIRLSDPERGQTTLNFAT